MAQKCTDCELPTKADIKPPIELRSVIKAKVRAYDSCLDPAISVDLASIGGGTATCETRVVDGVEYTVGPRGPINDEQWAAVGGGYDILTGDAAFSAGRKQYDFCGDMPLHWEYASDSAQATWDALKAQFATCCMCLPSPKIPKVKGDYVHQYSWAQKVEDLNTLPEWKQYDTTSGKTLMNPQVGTFRNAPQYSLKVSKEKLPPAAWKFEFDEYAQLHFYAGTCPDGQGFVTATGECEACPVGSFRSASDQDRIACQTCVDAFGADSHRTTKLPGQSVGTLWGTPCECDKGYYSWAEKRDDATSPTRYVCEKCPANTYKAFVGDAVGLCLACPAGTVSRAGAVAQDECRAPAAQTLGEYEREDHAYDALLGLVAHTARVQAAWTAPRPQYQDNSRRCALVAGGLGLDCPDLTHAGVFATAVTPSEVDNQVKLTAFGVGDDPALPGLLMHVGDAAHPQRYTVAMQPGAGNLLMYDTWFDRVDLKNTAKYVSLSLRKSYGGPRFPGFVEPVLGGLRTWPTGTKINYKLRVDTPGVDLSTTAVRVVTFLTTRKLESQADWQWIVCDSQGGEPEFCQHGADPDNVLKQNFQNSYVKAGTMFRLQPTKSCFTDLWWLDDCLDAELSPLNDRHDDVYEWVPFADSGETISDGEFFLYTTFHYGPTRQCAAHACVEADMYAGMSAHLSEPYAASDYAELRFLPGSEVTVQTKTAGVTYEPLLNTSLGLLSAAKYRHPLPPGGANAATFLALDETTATRPCALDAAGTSVACDGAEYPDVFTASVLDNAPLNLGAFETEFAALKASRECCADAVTESCAVEQAVCYDGFREDTAQSTARETYTQLAGFSADSKNLHDLLYQCGPGGNESCACSSSALAAAGAGTVREYPDRGAGIDACVADAANTLVAGGLCADAGLGLAVHASVAGPPSSVQYDLVVDDATVGVALDAQHTLLGQWVAEAYGGWPTVACTQPRVTAAPCVLAGDYVLPVSVEVYRTLIVGPDAALEGRMAAHDLLLRVRQTADALPVLRPTTALYVDAPLSFHDTTGGCGLACTDPLVADLNVVGEHKPVFALHAAKHPDHVPPCACDARDTVAATISGWSDGDLPRPDHVLAADDLTGCFATGTCPSQCSSACETLALETAAPTAVESIVYSGLYAATALEVSHMPDGGSSWLSYTTVALPDTTAERVDPERVYDLPLPLSALESCTGAASGCGFQTFARAKEIAEDARVLDWLVGAEADTCAQTCAAAGAGVTCDENVLYNTATQDAAVAAIARSPLHASAAAPYANVVGACTNAPLQYDGATFTFNDCPDPARDGFWRATAVHGIDPPGENLHTGALCHAQAAAQKLCPCSTARASTDAAAKHRLPTAAEVVAYEHRLRASLLSIDTAGLRGWYQFEAAGELGRDASGAGNAATVPASTVSVADAARGSAAAHLTEPLTVATVFNPQAAGFTAAFWLNVRQQTQFYYSFWAQSVADPDNQWFGFDYQSATDLRAHMSDGGDATTEDLPGMIAANTWVHLAWTLAPDGSWALYHNGVQRLSAPQRKTFNHDFTVAFKNVAGYSASYLDDVRLYERVLSAAEVRDIYRDREALSCGAACAAGMQAALDGWVPVTDTVVLGGGNLVCASAAGCAVGGATYPAHTLASEAYPAGTPAPAAYTKYRFSSAENLAADSRVYEVRLYTDSLCSLPIDTSSGVAFSSSWPSSESMWDGNDETWFSIPDSNFVTSIEATFDSPVTLGCVWIAGLGVMNDVNGVERHKGGVRVEAYTADAVWAEVAAPVPYSDATPLAAPGFLGAVVQHPLTGLGNTRSHLVKVKVPRSRYWRLAAAAPVDVLGVALCATPGCAAPNGAGRLCPRDAGLCYAEVPADNSCAQTVQRELQASAAGEVAAALFHSVQPVAPPADAYACAANHYVADGACAPCPANTFSPGGSAVACSPVQCAANEYHELDEWIVGEPGATCDATCGAVSKQCDAVMQSSIRSAEELQALVFDLIAVDCAAGDALNHAGAPLYKTSGTCHPFTTTWTDTTFSQLTASACDANDDPTARPLCRCHAGSACATCPPLHSAPAGSVGAAACQQTHAITPLAQPACSAVALAAAAVPYVMYDLGQHRGISEVQLKPRGRCGDAGGGDLAALQGFQVLVSDAPTLDASAIVCAAYDAADDAGLQYAPGGVLAKPCEVFGRYVFVRGAAGSAPAFDEFAVIPSPFAWEDTHRYRWSASVDAFQFLTLWKAPLSAVERQDDTSTTLDWAAYGDAEYFDYQVQGFAWANAHLSGGKTWQQLRAEQVRKPLFPPGAEQPLVATFDAKEAYVQFRLASVDAVGGVVIQPGPRFADGAWPGTWTHSWPGRVRVYSSLVDDFDAAVSSAVLLLDAQVAYEYDARGIPLDLSYTLPFSADAPVGPARFVRVVVNRCTEALCTANDADRLEFRVGFTKCVYKCAGCCAPVALVDATASPWLSLSGQTSASRAVHYASHTHCPFQNGNGATSFTPCQEGACATAAYALVYDGGLFKLTDASGAATPRLQVRRGATTTITWPASHPVVVSAEGTWGAAAYAHAATGTLQTTVSVPAGSALERLYYYCQNHETMGVGVLDVIPEDGVPPANIVCAAPGAFDYGTVAHTFAFAPVDPSTIYDATFAPSAQQAWFSARATFADYTVGDGHLFPSDPAASVAWRTPYAAGVAFLRPVSTNAHVAQQFVPWGVGTLRSAGGQAASAELVARRGFMGPGGTGFVEKLAMPASGWDRAATVEAELHLALKTRYREDDAYYPAWKDGRVVHLVSFVTDKLLDVGPTSTDFNWIVCGRLGQHLDAFPVPSLTLDAAALVGQQPPDGPQPATGVSYKTQALFVSQGGWLPNLPGLADVRCDPSSARFALDCNTAYSATTAALGYARCDLGASLAAQGPCAYTVKDVLDHYYYNSPKRFTGACQSMAELGAQVWYLPPTTSTFTTGTAIPLQHSSQLQFATNGGFTFIYKTKRTGSSENGYFFDLWDPLSQVQMRFFTHNSNVRFLLYEGESCELIVPQSSWTVTELVLDYDDTTKVFSATGLYRTMVNQDGTLVEQSTTAISQQVTCAASFALPDVDLTAAQIQGAFELRVSGNNAINADVYGLILFDQKLPAATSAAMLAAFDTTHHVLYGQGDTPTADHSSAAALAAFNAPCVPSGNANLDLLDTMAGAITRGLDVRTPVIKTHGDTAPVLLNKQRASVCHMDLYGAQVEFEAGPDATERFLPRRDYSVASNPPTGVDDRGQVPYAGYDSMACAVAMPALTDAAAEQAYLDSTPLATALGLFAGRHDCICGVVANVYTPDGGTTTLKVERTDEAQPDGHEVVFATPLSAADAAAGHVLGRGYVDMSGKVEGIVAVFPQQSSLADSIGPETILMASGGSEVYVDNPERGLALDYSQANFHFQSSSLTALLNQDAWTVSVWLYFESLGSYSHVFNSWDTSTFSPAFAMEAVVLQDGFIQFRRKLSNNNFAQTSKTFALQAATWYHLAFTSSATGLKIYVDGVERESTSHSSTWLKYSGSTSYTYIGLSSYCMSTTGCGSTAGVGLRQGLRFYNRKLTTTEVAETAAGETGTNLDYGTKSGPLEVFATANPADAQYGATTAQLPAEYDLCSAGPDPDHNASTNARNPHVLDGVVVPLGRTPKPTYQPPVDGLTAGAYKGAVEWPRDGCSFVKPHLSVTAALAAFADPDVPATKRALPSVADIGVIDETASSGEFEWFYGRAQLSAAGIPQFATACAAGADGLPEQVPCAYAASFGGLVLNADEAFLGTEFENEFVDLVFLPARGWRHVWFGQWKGAADRYYVRELNAGAARHHFAAGDLLIGGREGVGTAAERCPSSARYGNELGVLTWTPDITGAAAEYYLYTMFMVGESEACREHGCDEAAVYSAMDTHLAREPFPEERTPLVLMQGSRVGLKRAPTPRFALQPGCFAIDAVAGDAPKTYTITPSAAHFAQDLGALDACTGCVRGVCPASSAPCQFYDAAAGETYYSLPAGKAWAGGAMDAVLVLTEAVGGGALTGVALSTAGRPTAGRYADPAWAAGDTVYATSDVQCASAAGGGGGGRRRALQSLPLPYPRAAFGRPPARRVRVQSAVLPAKQEPVKLHVQHPRPATRRKLLAVGAGDLGMDKTAAGAQVQREITSVDGPRAMADAVCAGAGVCDLVRLEVEVPRGRYCDSEPELLRELDRQLALMNPGSQFAITTLSVYRPVFFSACFQSSVYMRRLLTDTRVISVLSAIQSQTTGDCDDPNDCQIVLKTENLNINQDSTLWGIETAMSLTGEPVGYRLCYGDAHCNSYIEIANTSTTKQLPVIEDNSPSPWAVAAIVLAVAFVIAGAFVVRNCWTNAVAREIAYTEVPKHPPAMPTMPAMPAMPTMQWAPAPNPGYSSPYSTISLPHPDHYETGLQPRYYPVV